MSEPTKSNSPRSILVFAVKATLVCLLVVFIALLTILAKSGYFAQERDPGRSARLCINHLIQIDAAANEFALEKGKTNGEPINFPNDLTPYIHLDKDGKIPSCPRGGIYSIKKVGEPPTCSLGTTVNPPHVLP